MFLVFWFVFFCFFYAASKAEVSLRSTLSQLWLSWMVSRQLWRTFLSVHKKARLLANPVCRCEKRSKLSRGRGGKASQRAFIVVVSTGRVPFWLGSPALFDDALTGGGGGGGGERGGRWCPLCAALRQPPSTAVMQKRPRSRWLCVKDPT